MVSGNTLRKFIPCPNTSLPVVNLPLLGGSGEGCKEVRGLPPVAKPNSVVPRNVGVGVQRDPGR